MEVYGISTRECLLLIHICILLQAKLLSKELDLVRTAQEQNSEEFEQVENNHRALEKKLKEKDWELQDMKAMKDAK